MDRRALADLLSDAGEAGAACRRALVSGADYEVWPAPVSTRELVGIYRRRERLSRRRGVSSIGFADAVVRLDTCGREFVLVGYVKGVTPAYHFQVFLSADASRVIACLGISQEHPPLAGPAPHLPPAEADGL
ncbi:hypothetical protein [Microbispora hainanensis]|uniref:Uncharacterized protein n=1 Tax=Microbispora hainanensis TaxID=568844 RepID=A0A544Y9S7_9ACTN|nr:hypothetical protein [Microbispora hainanensis]TQS13332.1 hypothetical protein FLX08_35270 [Microbispora hainanensis]